MTTSRRLAPAPIQQNRYLRARTGISIEEIARHDGVSKRTVEQSIQRVEAFRQGNSIEVVNEALSNSILKNKADMDRSINSALNAKRLVKDPEDGTYRSVPDHRVQLKAVDKLVEIAKTVQPKPGNVTKVNVGVGVGVRTTETNYLGFEERLRLIRAAMDAPAKIEAKTEVDDIAPPAEPTS
jgi:predicted DNA-binding protein YlxM (UPF0122 family)